MKKVLLIFLVAFLLNFIWENSHSLLYLHYKDGPITQIILMRATLADAVFITVLGVLFLKVAYFRQRIWYSFFIGVLAAIFIEIFALHTGMWVYNDLMPIVPIVKTGLTPTIQLGFLSYLIFKVAGLSKRNLTVRLAKSTSKVRI